ncbi:Zinc finger, CCCH-type [Trema orientale]|uniref:Zinc finger, CCCH-type n=1 Tax=Trema orientale TaxID=63057 RepID=A0A2P5F352_TREOI|nr:Zinc finger, CCCH-type [Trema orientale]
MQNSKEEAILSTNEKDSLDFSFSYLHGWLNKTPQFMMYYKIKPCKRTVCNFPFNPCPFLHEGEVGRRDLLWHKYSCTPCIHFKAGFCPQGVSCACAHGILEQRFHPMLFRTRFCWYMNSCKRKDCSYAHKEQEKRVPTIAPQVACPRAQSTSPSDIFTNSSSALMNPAIFNSSRSLPKNPGGIKRNFMSLHSENGDRPSYTSAKPELTDLS